MGIVEAIKETLVFSKDYTYECDDCGEIFEKTVAPPASISCPECGSENTRLIRWRATS